MVMRDIGSFHCPEPRARGQWKLPVSSNSHTLTVLLYRYNTFRPVYLHLLSFL